MIAVMEMKWEELPSIPESIEDNFNVEAVERYKLGRQHRLEYSAD